MRIYKFSPVSNDYQDLLPDDRRARSDKEWQWINSALSFDGKPKGKKWKAPPVFSLNPRQPTTDIWAVGSHSGGFAVTPKAYDRLAMFLEMAGELLPLPYKDFGLQICNITECANCLDAESSEWQKLPGGRRLLRKPAFHISCLPESTLFKIPEWPREMLCWERAGEPESEFKACVEACKFKGGFRGSFFELIWQEH